LSPQEFKEAVNAIKEVDDWTFTAELAGASLRRDLSDFIARVEQFDLADPLYWQRVYVLAGLGYPVDTTLMNGQLSIDQCQEIVYAFIDCMADNPPLIGDCSLLPYPKSVILYAIGELLNHYEHQQETINDPDLPIPGADDAPAPLHFSLPDSRYRYMIFCLSAVISAALAYDEKKQIQPEALINGCLHFARLTATDTEMAQEYFDDAASLQDSGGSTSTYLTEFSKHCAQWRKLEKEGNSAEIHDLICSMIHSAESSEPICLADVQRLGPLVLQIIRWLPTMHGACTELAKQS
jgi:hypothetical protein